MVLASGEDKTDAKSQLSKLVKLEGDCVIVRSTGVKMLDILETACSFV